MRTPDDARTAQEPVERLSLAVDGSFLASAGHDSCVHIWDTRMLSANDDGNEEQDEEEQAEEDEAKVRLGKWDCWADDRRGWTFRVHFIVM